MHENLKKNKNIIFSWEIISEKEKKEDLGRSILFYFFKKSEGSMVKWKGICLFFYVYLRYFKI